MVAASGLLALMALLVKLCAEIPTQEIVFVRSLVNVALTVALARHFRVSLVGKHRLSLFLRGIFGYGGLSLYFYSISLMPLADAVVIQNAAPLIVALLAPVALREPASWRVLALSGIGLLGVAIIVHPTGEVGLLAGLAALVGAVMAACAYLTISAIGSEEHPLTVVLYFPMISVVFSAVPTARAFVWPDLRQGLLLLGIGVTTTVAQICTTMALQRGRAVVVTTAAYTTVIFAALLGLLHWAWSPSRGRSSAA
jgi:drug/metabolite transporter (DMT)-like permease